MMNIGHKIMATELPVYLPMITKINNIVPVKYCDDGDEQWYEVVDPAKSSLVLLYCTDNIGKEVMVVFDKSTNFDILIDLF